jgi:hypothetical protein
MRPDIIASLHQAAHHEGSSVRENRSLRRHIEFQKRVLPHMHLLQILDKKDKIVSAEQVDDFISAEIPDRQ